MTHNTASDKPGADAALATALDLLDGTVCECGHLNTEHDAGEPPNACGGDGCACDQFSSVGFFVTRADEDA